MISNLKKNLSFWIEELLKLIDKMEINFEIQKCRQFPCLEDKMKKKFNWFCYLILFLKERKIVWIIYQIFEES